MNLLSNSINARITEIISIKDGCGTIRYETETDSGCVDVIAEGWGDGYPDYWPPQIGDHIEIITRPVVILKRR